MDGDDDVNDTEIIDMGAYEMPKVWYVDADANGDGSDWSNAFKSLKDALTAASSGDRYGLQKVRTSGYN